MLKLNFSLSEGSRTHNHRIITENLPLLILQIVATSRVINLLFSQKYQALQITQSDPTAVLRHFLLISKTWLSLKNIAGDTVPEFYSIWIPFSQELLHASKNWPEWQQQVWGQSLSHRTSMHAGEKKKNNNKSNQQNQSGELFLEHVCSEISETGSVSYTGCGVLALANQCSPSCSFCSLEWWEENRRNWEDL